jgi:hypothetical protein
MIFVSSQNHREIGGYMGFDLNNLNQFPYHNSRKYNSARSAFLDLLQNLKVESIWVPKFICDTMLKPLEILKINIKFYDLDINFYPQIPSELEKNDYLLYVNYFGICTQNQEKLVSLYPCDKIIFDHSQAFFVEPFEGAHTIYSPRKFFAVADGGLLVTEKDIKPVDASNQEDELIEQYKHLFIRSISCAQQGYMQFQKAEAMLNGCIPKKISPITELILNNIDYLHVKARRLNNFKYLHSKLGKFNQLNICLENLESPLTYPFLSSRKYSEYLIKHKIFIPTYWNDCLTRVSSNSTEYQFVNGITHFVCDQRYSFQDMQHQIEKIQEYLI